jgi:hypothetical protein
MLLYNDYPYDYNAFKSTTTILLYILWYSTAFYCTYCTTVFNFFTV